MIINMTQHPATPEQVAAGVIDLPQEAKEAVQAALTFDTLPTSQEIEERASWLAEFAATWDITQSDDGGAEIYPTAALIGGAPFLMSALESALKDRYVTPLYAFSKRESVEKRQADGSIIKTNVFRHIGFFGSST
jgi:hypothetical protein